MPDPLKIEQQYQSLIQSLNILTSPRNRIIQILGFMDPLITKSPHFLAAYLTELIPRLSSSVLQAKFLGTDTAFLNRLTETIDKLTDIYPSYKNDEQLTSAAHYLHSEKVRLSDLIKNKSGVSTLIKSSSNSHIDKVWIPLVETEALAKSFETNFATLGLLKVEVNYSSKTGADEFRVSNLKEKSDNESLQSALSAARNLFSRVTKTDINRKLLIHCFFDNTKEIRGESLLAGLTAVLFTEMLRLNQFRQEFRINNDVAISGGIDKDGILQRVDENGLMLKVEACYFSHIRYLVVPKEQEEICKDAIAKLNLAQEHSSTLPPKNGGLAQTDGYADQTQQAAILSNPEFGEGKLNHPTSHISPLTAQNTSNIQCLEVVGISNLEELFYNRKFTDSRRITVARQTIRKVWKLRRSIAALLIISLLLVIGKMWYGPLDKNPVDYSADGEMLSLKNKYGEVVEKIIVGNNTVRDINYLKSQNICNIVNLFDINGDKINEVIYAQSFQASDNVSRVFCKDIIKDSIYWSVDILRKLKFPQHPYVSSEVYDVINISVGDYDNDERPEIYINARHNRYFPGLLIKLDAASGEKLAEYIHIGQCLDMAFVDIDSDSVVEVILGGVSNAYDMAAVTILDSRFIEGHAPTTNNYSIEDFKPGLEKAYILIPRTIVGNHYRNEYRHNNVQLIQKSDRSINLAITDCPLPTDNKKLAVFFVELNYDLSVKEIGTGNEYDLLSRQLYAEGKLKQRVGVEYFNEYKKEILYWDGEKFVNYPTLNKRYLEAVAALDSARGK